MVRINHPSRNEIDSQEAANEDGSAEMIVGEEVVVVTGEYL